VAVNVILVLQAYLKPESYQLGCVY